MILEKETNLYSDNAIARGITENILNYDTSLNQLAVFNKLTNNGQIQGLFMSNGDLYMNASHITTGTLAAARIGAHSIAVSKLTGLIQNGNWKIDLDEGTMTIGNISASNITSGTLSVDRISPNSVSVDKLTGQITNSNWNINLTTGTLTIGNISANNITSGTLSVDRIGRNTVAIDKLTGQITNNNWTINLTDGTLTIGNISANNITTGTLSASRIGGHSLAASKLTGSISNGNWGIDFDAGTFSIGNISANNITTGTMSAARISGGTLTLGGANNGNGQLVVKNASNTNVVTMTNSGISITSGSINIGSGKFVVDTNGNLTSKSLTATDSISVVGGSGSEIYIPNLANNGYCRLNKDGFLVKVDAHYVRCGRVAASSSSSDYAWAPFIVSSGLYSSATYRWILSSYGFNLIAENVTRASMTSYGNASLQSLNVNHDLNVSGTKSRITNTDDYGNRKLYCYETPSPLFGDLGEGVISSDGKCFVMLDSIFAKTVTLSQYHVFLQKCGDGDCWVSEKTSGYFVVEGTPNLKFSWELKAKQKDFDQYRLEQAENAYEKLLNDNKADYAMDFLNHIDNIQHEREVSA